MAEWQACVELGNSIFKNSVRGLTDIQDGISIFTLLCLMCVCVPMHTPRPGEHAYVHALFLSALFLLRQGLSLDLLGWQQQATEIFPP